MFFQLQSTCLCCSVLLIKVLVYVVQSSLSVLLIKVHVYVVQSSLSKYMFMLFSPPYQSSLSKYMFMLFSPPYQSTCLCCSVLLIIVHVYVVQSSLGHRLVAVIQVVIIIYGIKLCSFIIACMSSLGTCTYVDQSVYHFFPFLQWRPTTCIERL